MFKQKLTGAVLAACLFAVAGGLSLHVGTASNAAVTASAAQTQLDTESASLFLPESYEQYLTLESPSDIAVSERYIAIAEESKIYIFDREASTPAYQIYDHATAHSDAQISKIQFSQDEELYFSDNLLGFYQLDLNDLNELKPTSDTSIVPLSTFYIEGETIFEVSVVNSKTTYLSAPLSDPTSATQFATDSNTVTPCLSFSNGTFFSAVGALVTTYSYSSSKNIYEPKSSFPLQPGLSGVKSATVAGGDLFYTVTDSTASATQNGLYRYDLAARSYSLVLEGSDFGALTSYDGKLYAVKGNAVMEYSLEGGVNKTNYEISSSSDSVNRLSDATDSARAGNLLVTADAGNSRLSIYDMEEEDYAVLSIRYEPKFVATDGEIIAVAAEKSVYVYARDRLGDFAEVFFYDTSTVSGIVCLYGKCYFVTHNFGYGVIERGENGYAATARTRDSISEQAPAALAGDLYGNLYVVSETGAVLKYTENNFTDERAQGERLDYSLPDGFQDVEADFEGHIYCLVGGTLYQNGTAFASIDGKDFVYGDGSPIPPVTYALGFEDDCVYFNFGNFIVRTNAGALGFPTLSTIDAAGIHETLQLVHTPDEVRHMDVQKGAIGIKVDLSTLHEDTVYFPYDSYARTEELYRGVLLAEKGNYLLIALYHDRAYDMRLFRRDQCTETEITAETHAENKHLSSDCRLYNYPCIADAYSETLPRGTVLKVLSTVAADPDAADPDLGYTFAYVEVETKTRETVRGYVPLSFLTDSDPAGGNSDDFELVNLKKDVVFTDGEETKRLEKGTEVKLYTNEDGSYLGTYTDAEGRTWSQTLTEDMIERGQSDALRIALIVGLSVLALVIIGAYFALLPHKKKS